MHKRILLPLDGSALAEQATPHAIAQAEHLGAELILLKVLPPWSRGASPRRAGRRPRSCRLDWLASIQRAWPPASRNAISWYRWSRSKDSLTGRSSRLVMSTWGQSGLSRWLMGSVADRVIRGATIPVRLIRATEARGE